VQTGLQPGHRLFSSGGHLIYSGTRAKEGGERGGNVKGGALISKALVTACTIRLSKASVYFLADLA
jgi:hypothetical protein